MKGSFLCFAVLFAVTACRTGSGLQRFFIGGLFPNDSDDVELRDALGVYPKLAAQLAVQHINEAGLLSALNFSLEMLAFGTSCKKDAAVYAYLQLMEALQEKEDTSEWYRLNTWHQLNIQIIAMTATYMAATASCPYKIYPRSQVY